MGKMEAIECFPADRQHMVSLYSEGVVIGEAYYINDSGAWDYDTFTPAGRRVHIGEFDQLEQIISMEEERQV